TIGVYLASENGKKLPPADHPAVLAAKEEANGRLKKLLSINGKRTPSSFHRELGLLLWNLCGMARNRDGLQQALKRIPELREEFFQNLTVPGEIGSLNQALEIAGRVSDYLEFAELMCFDALQREESCGAHFREEYQTEDGEAKRDDEHYAYVSAWEH